RGRTGAGVRTPRLESDPDRGRTGVPRPRRARGRRRAAASPRGRRHDAGRRRPMYGHRTAADGTVGTALGGRPPFEVWSGGTRKTVHRGPRPPPQRGGVARRRIGAERARLVAGGPGDARSAA